MFLFIQEIYIHPIFIRACFRHALKKPAPQTIPRSGEEGAKVDCYAVKIQIDKYQSFWVERICGNILSGYIYDQRSEQRVPYEMHLSTLDTSTIEITKFKGYYDISFSSLIEFFIKDFSSYIHIKMSFLSVIDRTLQYAYNRKTLQAHKRIEVIKFLIQRHLYKREEFNIVDLMLGLHSLRLINHPDKNRIKGILKLYVESFIETEEILRLGGGRYKITGKAISTLEEYENVERKHSENKRLQEIIAMTTIILMLLAAGLIKFPVMLDFT